MKNAAYSHVARKTDRTTFSKQDRPNQAEIDDVKLQIEGRTGSPEMDVPKFVVAYLRVSTDLQSIEMQRETIRMLCFRFGYDFDKVIFYEDEGVSAYKKARRNMTDRKGGRSMQNMIILDRVEAVLAYRLDRLFRSAWVGLKWVEELVDKGIELWTQDVMASIHTSDGRRMAGYSLVNAEAESSVTSDRTKDGIKSTRKQGGRITQSQWGWDWDEKNEIMIPNWQEKSVIDWMKIMFENGESKRKIGKMLKDVGLRGKRGGRTWQSGTISSILDSEQHELYSDWDDKTPKTTYPFKYLRQKQMKENPEWFGL